MGSSILVTLNTIVLRKMLSQIFSVDLWRHRRRHTDIGANCKIWEWRHNSLFLTVSIFSVPIFCLFGIFWTLSNWISLENIHKVDYNWHLTSATSPTSRLPVHISLKSYVSLQYKTFIWFEWAKIQVYCLTYWSSVFNHEFLAVLAFCTKIRKNTKKTLIWGENDIIMTSWWRHNDVYPIEIN